MKAWKVEQSHSQNSDGILKTEYGCKTENHKNSEGKSKN